MESNRIYITATVVLVLSFNLWTHAESTNPTALESSVTTTIGNVITSSANTVMIASTPSIASTAPSDALSQGTTVATSSSAPSQPLIASTPSIASTTPSDAPSQETTVATSSSAPSQPLVSSGTQETSTTLSTVAGSSSVTPGSQSSVTASVSTESTGSTGSGGNVTMDVSSTAEPTGETSTAVDSNALVCYKFNHSDCAADTQDGSCLQNLIEKNRSSYETCRINSSGKHGFCKIEKITDGQPQANVSITCANECDKGYEKDTHGRQSKILVCCQEDKCFSDSKVARLANSSPLMMLPILSFIFFI